MERSSMDFLKRLVETPSPSGFEQAAQKLVRDRLKGAVDEIRTDVHGNVIGVLNAKAPLRVMLAGHCDEIGLMVTHVDENGYIYFSAIGGIDPAVLAGQAVEVHTPRGTVPGVIGKKAIHLMEKEDVGKPSKIKDLWIDIGARDRKDALKVVSIGDAATVARTLVKLRNDFITARGFDDRVGAWAVVETMRQLSKRKLNVAVYGVTTVQEELGLRGAHTAAYAVDPHVGIAVDVGFSSDYPEIDKKVVGEVSLGKGSILHRGANINPRLASLMEASAKRHKIPHQMQAEPRATGTDANIMQIKRGGAAAALVSIPNRYMHTPVEVCSTIDLDETVNLLVAAVCDMKPAIDFTP